MKDNLTGFWISASIAAGCEPTASANLTTACGLPVTTGKARGFRNTGLTVENRIGCRVRTVLQREFTWVVRLPSRRYLLEIPLYILYT
jgi:hypothetical protein